MKSARLTGVVGPARVKGTVVNRLRCVGLHQNDYGGLLGQDGLSNLGYRFAICISRVRHLQRVQQNRLRSLGVFQRSDELSVYLAQ